MRMFLISILACCSMLICIATGWCWHRSYAIVDIISRDSLSQPMNKMRGVGSYRGALLIGTVDLPTLCDVNLEINRREITVSRSRDTVRSSIGAQKDFLGFGSVTGSMPKPVFGGLFTVNLPFRAVYVPYYFIMLITAILSGWMLLALLLPFLICARAKGTRSFSNAEERVPSAQPLKGVLESPSRSV
jgi:hypothetical protein